MEQRFKMGEGNEITRRCWREIRKKAIGNGEKSGWKEKRIEFYSRKGIEIEEQRKEYQ